MFCVANVIMWDQMLSCGSNVVKWIHLWDQMFSSRTNRYHVLLMLPCVANFYPAFFQYFDIPKLANFDRALTWTLILCINLLRQISGQSDLRYTYSLLTLICTWKCRFYCLLANHPIGFVAPIATKISFTYSFSEICAASVPISTFMCL